MKVKLVTTAVSCVLSLIYEFILNLFMLAVCFVWSNSIWSLSLSLCYNSNSFYLFLSFSFVDHFLCSLFPLPSQLFRFRSRSLLALTVLLARKAAESTVVAEGTISGEDFNNATNAALSLHRLRESGELCIYVERKSEKEKSSEDRRRDGNSESERKARERGRGKRKEDEETTT